MTSIATQSHLASLAPDHSTLISRLQRDRIVERIWERDHTVWHPDPTEISNRLGWLDSPVAMQEEIAAIDSAVAAVRADGFTYALLLGMGGSSLAPEVFRKVFGVRSGFLDLTVLDTTDPAAVRSHAERLEPARTLFIPATKSGGTVETISLLKYFYNRTQDGVGDDKAGQQFIAITDPGSGLAELAADLHFRHTFLNNSEIGGRYSALSLFGMVPAHLIGVDTTRLLDRARIAADECRGHDANFGLHLGAAIASAAMAGRDKLTFLADATLTPIGAWIEQLIAESTGKEGKGILPVDGEPPGSADEYGDDRLFAYLRHDGEFDELFEQLCQAGHPVLRLDISDDYDISGEFFRWEMATAIASHCLGINPFDQPNVEAAKVVARTLTEAYIRDGELPQEKAIWSDDGLSCYGDVVGDSLSSILRALIAGVDESPSYFSIHAYLTPGDDIDDALATIRAAVHKRDGIATTTGYGPRFLHSTGQLHKGDGGKGCFLQLTCDDAVDVQIPDSPGDNASAISFSVLKAAQASGDFQALQAAGRRVVRVHLGSDVRSGLERISAALS